MNQATSSQPKKHESSIWFVVLVACLTAGLGIWIALATRGLEVLNISAWMWSCLMFCTVGSVGFHLIASKLGDASNTMFMLKMGLGAAITSIGSFVMVGVIDLNHAFGDGTQFAQQMVASLGSALTWFSFVLVPLLVFASNMIFVLLLRHDHRSTTVD